tara:strand:+ start:5037 stop:5699 length:663 start_codon:yes stop_codon:yes gene_type:complete
MRQHVNPLSHFFQVDRELPAFHTLYEKEELPLHIDIGCARGKFLIELSQLDPNWNYLGLDIRASLISSANREKEFLNLNNLAFLFCNANVSLQSCADQLRYSKLKRVSIQFPDPWFKRRHYKRRILQPELLFLLSNTFEKGSQFFIQSDVYSILEEMELLILSTNCFIKNHPNNTRFIAFNPFKITTEREKYAIINKLPIYRVLFERNSNKCIDLSTLKN